MLGQDNIWAKRLIYQTNKLLAKMWGQVKTISGRALSLGQASGPSAAAIFIKKYIDIRNVGLGKVKAISGPSAAARTDQGAERCDLIYQTNKFLAEMCG